MARYSRKDYQMVAEHIKEQWANANKLCDNNGWDIQNPSSEAIFATLWKMSKSFAKTFSDDNPNFREDQFLTACGVK